MAGASADVQPQAGAAARVRGQQPAQHADGGGLAAAVGAEEAADAAGSAPGGRRCRPPRPP
jgi:hypothetical protein